MQPAIHLNRNHHALQLDAPPTVKAGVVRQTGFGDLPAQPNAIDESMGNLHETARLGRLGRLCRVEARDDTDGGETDEPKRTPMDSEVSLRFKQKITNLADKTRMSSPFGESVIYEALGQIKAFLGGMSAELGN